MLEIDGIMKAAQYGAMLFLIVLFFIGLLRKRYPIWILIISSVIVLSFVIASIVTSRLYLMLYVMFIIVAPLFSLKLEYIAKVSLVSCVVSLIIILLLCKAGILQNLIYKTDNREAHCLGFSYYSSFPYICFFCILMYMFLRKNRFTVIEALALLSLSFVLYQQSTVRLVFYLSCFAIVTDYFLVHLRWLNLNVTVVRVIGTVSFFIGILVIFWCTKHYDPDLDIWQKMNQIFSGRLGQAATGFDRYGINLFGNAIEMHGNSALETTIEEEYFYIDSGFAYSLLGYGLLFSIIVTVLYSFLMYYACLGNNKPMFVWVVSILLFTLVNNMWLTIDCNPILLFSLCGMKEIRYKRAMEKDYSRMFKMMSICRLQD